MSTRSYLAFIFIGSLLCFGYAFLIIVNLTPEKAGALGIALLLLSLFFGLIGVLTLSGFYLRVWASGNEVYYSGVSGSLRQAFVFSLAIFGILYLKFLKVLTWWDGLLVFFAAILLDLYLKRKR